MAGPFTFRPMTSDDMERAHALSTSVRWPHTREDWTFVLGLGTGIVAIQDETVVGTSMWWRVGSGASRIGMVIVDPALQRVGLGRALMDRSLAAAGDGTIMLTATAAGAPLYARLGFASTGAIRQHQGLAAASPPRPLQPGQGIERASRTHTDLLVELDARAMGVQRASLIHATAALAETAVLSRETTPVGFAMCRRFGRGLLVGPLVAETRQDAEALLAYWIAEKAGQFLRVDIPVSSELSPFLERHGLVAVDEALSMTRGSQPMAGGPQRSFALINQALG